MFRKLKQFIPAALVLAMLLGLLCPAFSLGESEALVTGSILRTAKQANMRKKPDTGSDLVERLDPHREVLVLNVMQVEDETWAQVQAQKSKRQGYILASLLEPLPTPTPTPTATPVPTPSPVPTPTPTPTPDYSNVSFDETDPAVLRTAKDCNVRKDSDKGSMILEKLAPHSVIRVLSTDGIWSYIKVKRSGRLGWIMSELLEPIPTPTPTPTPSPVPTPTAVPTPSPTPVPSNPQELSAIEEHFDEPMLLRTVVNTNIRQMPGGKRLTSLDGHTKVNAIGRVMWDGSSWLHIQGVGSIPSGYIAEELLEQIRPTVTVQVSEEEIRTRFLTVSFDPLADLEDETPFSYTQEELDRYSTLKYGSKNDEVIALKERLYELEYYQNSENLYNPLYTRSTADIIARFQRDAGLEDTGEADPLTQCMLFDERTPHKQTGPKESLYMTSKQQPMWIQRAETSSYDFYGSVQVAVRNQTGNNVSSFTLKVIPNSKDGEPMGWESSFGKEIVREYTIKDLSVPPNYTYSDFETNEEADWEFTWPHHFVVAYQTYFSGAQIAISKYKAGGRTFVIDDDQLVWVPVGKGVTDILMHTLPIEITPEERNFASGWELGAVTHYVWPVYRDYYSLPQGAYVESVSTYSAAEDAGLEPGDIIVGIDNITILGDATLRQARGRMQPGDIAELYYWRNGQYYRTELIRPQK